MSKFPPYINSPSWRSARNELIATLAGFTLLALFLIGLTWLALELTGGAR